MNENVKNDFEKFLFEEAGSSGRGTVSTYIRALDVLNDALARSVSQNVPRGDVWQIESPAKLMSLQRFVVEQQRKYVQSRAGIFSSLSSGGRSYYEKRWCSAALRQLAAFRQTEIYAGALNTAFDSSKEGAAVSDKVRLVRLGTSSCFVPENVDPDSREGKEAVAVAKRRINQSVFRRWIVGLYENRCCVTGLNVPEVLRASHIVSWASDKQNRMNPCNGLCLSATYDAAFDRHLISFDEEYRMVLSKRIRDFCDNATCANYFLKMEGRKIDLPTRFFPSQKLLAKHRALLVS